MKTKSGFTLIELLIVVSIIGILATLVLPRLSGQDEKGRVAEAMGFLSAMRRGQMAYYDARGVYVPNFFDTGGTSASQANWDSLGLQRPNTSPSQVYWLYGTFAASPGSVQASRTALANRYGTAGSILVLRIDGAWTGSGDYGPSRRFAPTK